ncbi:MAG: nucleotidyltransferase domain-containing protein [Candidatus Methanoperedens sp.]|nr:nucleotidyltransferase domain-containing protein [Candidatus Methanoperedens sp.]
MNPDEIARIANNAIDKLKNIQGFEKVKFIILFGSASEGTARENSDIDLCIDIDTDIDIESSRLERSAEGKSDFLQG